jgi:prolyl-tRNA synthetase
LTTVEEVAGSLGIAPGNLLKAFPVVTASRGLVVVFLRGDHRVEDVKLANALGEPFAQATTDELEAHGLVAGYIGPSDRVAAIYDAAVAPGRYVSGGNAVDRHAVVEVAAGERLDVRRVEAGDTVGGHAIRLEPAIEIGNIFKLGTRYSEPLGATYLDDGGRERLIVMGSYGIGPARVAAAAVEQFADDKGISWPRAIAPWDVHLVVLGKGETPERAAAEALYAQLRAAGMAVLFDDRDAGVGEKLTDAELLGVPLRLTLGKRTLELGAVEAQVRRGAEDRPAVPLEGAAEAVAELWQTLP